MKRLVFLFLLFYTVFCDAQHYRNIDVEDGLSSRKVYSIQKDRKGFMWFLTHEGIDRYDGSEFKHYALSLNGRELNSLQDLNWLYTGQEGNLWQISKKGRIFRYNPLRDEFENVYQIPPRQNENPTPISFSFIDNTNTIWLCGEEIIYLFNNNNNITSTIQHHLGMITYVTQYDDTKYFIGTEKHIHFVEYKDGELKRIPVECLDHLSLQINELYLDKPNNYLYIGTFQKGVYVYNLANKTCDKIQIGISDMSVTRIIPLNDKEVLVATDGAGVYKIDTETLETQPYIVSDYRENNATSSNNINDIFIDSVGRIWLANYPIGITIRDDRYWNYSWFRHAMGNAQSLVNDQVNAIFEDSEGDLWFATSNGISLYRQKTKEWRSFLSTYNTLSQTSTYAFLSLCESSPGVIYAAGYGSTIYKIDKRNMSVSILPLNTYKSAPVRTDKYIQAMLKDSQGNIWIGGYLNLKEVNEKTKEIRLFPELNNITTILEYNEENIWIGTGKGLYLLNKTTGQTKRIATPSESTYIYSLCQPTKDRLYIGTNGSGLLIYNLQNDTFSHFHKNNSALLSNNIYTILSNSQGHIVLSSENGLTRFYPRENDFHNWTKEQGLKTNSFNPNAGIFSKHNKYIFGSNDGAIEFDEYMHLPREYKSKMIFNDFRLFYESVYPGSENSPLEKDIDDTEIIELNYNQNIFSLKISSINYDYPSNILYSWKLEGFYNSWSRAGRENIIRFTNLSPGRYTLHVRAISNENRQILEERTLEIIIAQPFWQSIWAIILYILLSMLAVTGIARLVYLRKQRKLAAEKFQFFINTAHDIRTPLTLIKAPLEELKDKEHLSESGVRNMNTAMRNVNALLRLTNNMVNYERMDIDPSGLYIGEYELNAFMGEIIQSFQPYTENKKLTLDYESNFNHLNVWFDKEKMESTFKNVISNAIKYTPKGGSIKVRAFESATHWTIEIADTGIGIPINEQKKAFKTYFRGSNAINSKITGSGIGMVLVGKQVDCHKGKIDIHSVEHQGTTVKITFPKGNKHYKKAHISGESSYQTTPLMTVEEHDMTPHNGGSNRQKSTFRKPRILVVEDNDELRSYYQDLLSEEYDVQVCENGRQALLVVKDLNPDLILSDIMMPEMGGEELYKELKSDLETSHIPIILLSALNDEERIVKALQAGIDDYIVKPFNNNILKASIRNKLALRDELRKTYANVEAEEEAKEACKNCMTEIDWKFIEKLNTLIDTNMGDTHFNIDHLASDMNMSRTSLYNKIRGLTDLNPRDYILIMKLDKASQLLEKGETSVTQVAEMIGFSDPKYFREVFKKHFGVSPSDYKKGARDQARQS